MNETKPNGQGALKRRFYDKAHISKDGDYYRVMLDDLPLLTPAKRPVLTASEAHGAWLAREWQDQGDSIQPFSMPHNRLYNAILDRLIGLSWHEALSPLLALCERDQLFVFADHPSALKQEQEMHWQPALDWCRERLGYVPMLSETLHAPSQSPVYLQAIEAFLVSFPVSTLGALQALSDLTDSLLLGLCHLDACLDFNQIWQAAHVDEDYQIAYWGQDDEAAERRHNRRLDAEVASKAMACFNLDREKTGRLERYLLSRG